MVFLFIFTFQRMIHENALFEVLLDEEQDRKERS